eukprot:7781383-Pyramimonas_sp.AAC.1
MLHDSSHEWQLPLWAAAIDFKKALDCVGHDCMWDALRKQHIPPAYITCLQHLYSAQAGTIRTDTSSRAFNIERGVKQGDPLSSFLFDAVLEHVFRQVILVWLRKKFGIHLGFSAAARIANLRFAGDVSLCDANLRQLTCLFRDVQTHAAKCGLLLHPEDEDPGGH